MTLANRQQIAFEYEMYGGLKTSLSLKAEEHEAVGAMSFRKLSQPKIEYTGLERHREFLRTTELFAEIRYAPDETYINSKQRRVTINKDAPSPIPSASRTSLAVSMSQTSPRLSYINASG